LDRDELERGPHARLLAWCRDLLRLQRERSSLRDPRPDLVHVVDETEAGLSSFSAASISRSTSARSRAPSTRAPANGALCSPGIRVTVMNGGEINLGAESAAVLERVASQPVRPEV
jgi:hypothetical protein